MGSSRGLGLTAGTWGELAFGVFLCLVGAGLLRLVGIGVRGLIIWSVSFGSFWILIITH
jgi:hypothetical protein